jgi:predicted N-formylglutamate amidohydrolase
MVEHAAPSRDAPSHLPPVLCLNAGGASPFVLVCDHASNRIPDAYGDLGLTPAQRVMHVAWDPGALAVARQLSDLLDAPLVQSTVCRLVIDCNRDVDAPDLVPVTSERTEIPGNRDLGAAEKQSRISAFHAPFHQTIDALLGTRAAAGIETILVTVHSFTPVYKDVHRPWPIGLIHGTDPAFSAALRQALLEEEPRLELGWNQPYSAMNGVTFTLEHHGDGRELPASMIEIRHDEILAPEGVAFWARRLQRALQGARLALHSPSLIVSAGLMSEPGGING